MDWEKMEKSNELKKGWEKETRVGISEFGTKRGQVYD